MLKLNDKEISFHTFPNGELYLKKEDIVFTNEYYHINWKYKSNSDFIELFLLKSFLDEEILPHNIFLFIEYMPFSRMDRNNESYAFTLKYVAKFINSMNFSSVRVLEPHSDVTTALLDNCVGVSVTQFNVNRIKDIVFDGNEISVYYPDAGAQKRYEDMFPEINSLVGFKKRDFETGRIKSLSIVGDKLDTDKVIIVDDLCSRGGTFMLSAEKLKELGFKEIYLYVTHCENTIYDGDILKTDLINHVFTTDSIFKSYNEQKTDKITVFKL